MKIYTGQVNGKVKREKLRELGVGIMLSSAPNDLPRRDYRGFSCALDNGAFSCHKKGYPFMGAVFLRALDAAYKFGITLDFIVCPDVVCGGDRSLAYSLEWANAELKTAPRLALVVQDGMRPESVSLERFTHLFVGGSVAWKWKTAATWAQVARAQGKQCHIGQCGQLKHLERAQELGVDSVDSTSWAVNDSWHIVENFLRRQTPLPLPVGGQRAQAQEVE